MARIAALRPISVTFVQLLSKASGLAGLFVVLAVCVVPFFIGLAVAWAQGASIEFHTSFWLRLNLFLITVNAFIVIDLIYRRAKDIGEDIVYPIRNPEDVRRISDAYDFMYCSPLRYASSAVLLLAGIVSALLFLGLPFDGVLYGFYALYGGLVILLLSEGVWLTIGISYLSYAYSRCRSMTFNLLSPLDTIGVRHLSDLSTTWGMCFTLQAILVLFGIWAAPWDASRTLITWTSGIWTLVVVIMTAHTVLFPKFAIRGLVNSGKRNHLRWLHTSVVEYERAMTTMDRSEVEARDRALALLREYNETYKLAARAPISSIDFKTGLKLVGSLAVPIIVFCLQNPKSVSALIDYFTEMIP